MKAPDFRTINEHAFDVLSKRYVNKRGRLNSSSHLVQRFSQLVGNFPNPVLLEIGVGSGFMLRYFSGKGVRTVGIDISYKMIEAAMRNSPYTEYIHDDFLSHEFTAGSFSGVFADAVLYLFPKDKIDQVFDKVYKILQRRGYFCLSVPVFDKPSQEVVKRGAGRSQILEYRVKYTLEEFIKILYNSRFKVVRQSLTEFEDTQGSASIRLNNLLTK